MVFRESCHQDTSWLHMSSILRTPVPFVTVAMALSLLGHWGALSLHATVPAVTKTGSVEGREMLKKPEKNCRLIRKKTNQVLFLWWQSWHPTELRAPYRGVGLCLVVGSARFLQADLQDILQAQERGVLNLLSLSGSSFLSGVGHARQGGLAEQVHISCRTPENQVI